MKRKKYNLLNLLLTELQNRAPCGGKSCVGYQNCEYGISGSYGGECSIETVIQGVPSEYKEELI